MVAGTRFYPQPPQMDSVSSIDVDVAIGAWFVDKLRYFDQVLRSKAIQLCKVKVKSSLCSHGSDWGFRISRIVTEATTCFTTDLGNQMN